MKILLYVNSYLPLVGGRELVVHTLAMQMQKLGHDVHVAGPGGVWKFRKHKFDYPLHRWFKVPFVDAETGFALHLRRTCLLRHFDVIHAHSTYPTGYMAAKLKDTLKIPLVLTPHGNDINVDSNIQHGLRLDPALDSKIRFALSKADAITAISDQVGKSLQAAGVAPEEIISLPNGVDLARFERTEKDETVDVRSHFGLPPNAKLVVTIGNYHRRKGHEVLIRAAKQARAQAENLTLVIVGAKNKDLVESCRREGLDDWLCFTGAIPPPKEGQPDLLAALLKAAHIYVSSSISNTAEGMSLALLEAMAAGTSVVASNISGSADLLAAGRYGMLVEPNNAEALAAGLSTLLTDKAAHARMQEAALERAKQFSWEEITNRYLELYRRVID